MRNSIWLLCLKQTTPPVFVVCFILLCFVFFDGWLDKKKKTTNLCAGPFWGSSSFASSWLAATRSQRSCSGSWERAWPCRSAHHRPVARDGVSCVRSVSANQASPRRREELIFVDGVLCTLPWAGRFGVSPGKPGLCSRWGPVGGGRRRGREGDNYQTRSRLQWHKSRFDFLTAGRLRGTVPLGAHPAHPDHFSSLLRGRDVLFHNKTWNWLLSAPVNWT